MSISQKKKVDTLDMVKCYLTGSVLFVAEYIKKPWAHVIRGVLNEEDVAACKDFLLAEQDAMFKHSEEFGESHMFISLSLILCLCSNVCTGEL